MKEINHKKQLRTVKKEQWIPCVLSVKGVLLYCDTPLRILPGKRITLAGHYQNRKVVAKLFLDRVKWQLHGKREQQGATALTDAHIPTPTLLYAGKADVLGVYVVIYEFIEGAKTFDELWKMQQNVSVRKTVLLQLYQLIQEMHKAGLYQQDNHLDNFLIANEKIMAIDGQAVRKTKAPLSTAKSLDNLAGLLAQFLCGEDLFNLAVLQDKVDKNSIQPLINQHRTKRTERYLTKIERECTAFVAEQCFDQRVIINREENNSALRRLLNAVDESIAKANQVLKNGNSATVVKVSMDNSHYVIKRYNVKNKLHLLRRCFRTTRASVSWRNAHHLLWLGIATPKPIALMEKRFGLLRKKAYFITCYMKGLALNDYIIGALHLDAKWQQQAIATVELLLSLYQSQFVHGDLKASNILIVNEKPMIIDLDAMQHHHDKDEKFVRAWQNEVKRFMRNWDDYPRVQEFFKRCMQEKGLLV